MQSGFGAYAKQEQKGFESVTGSGFGKPADGEFTQIKESAIDVSMDKNYQHKTGEEKDTVLGTLRCKLYRLSGSDWTHVGVGPLKILKSEDGNCRLVLRRESSLNGLGTTLLMNIGLQSCTSVQRRQGRALSLTSVKSEDGKLVPTSFLLRAFRDEDFEVLERHVLEK